MSHSLHTSPSISLVIGAMQINTIELISTGELGPAEEFTARIDIELDSPGPSRVIQSVGLKARSGTVRVHAPKHLQVLRETLQGHHSTSPLGFDFSLFCLFVLFFSL